MAMICWMVSRALLAGVGLGVVGLHRLLPGPVVLDLGLAPVDVERIERGAQRLDARPTNLRATDIPARLERRVGRNLDRGDPKVVSGCPLAGPVHRSVLPHTAVPQGRQYGM